MRNYTNTERESERLDQLIALVVTNALRQAIYEASTMMVRENPYLRTQASRDLCIQQVGDEIIARLGAYMANAANDPEGSYAQLTPREVHEWLKANMELEDWQ